MPDTTLVRRLLAGDETAFDEFFADYFPRVYRFAVARLDGDGAAAEDVAQATLSKGLDRLRTYRGEAALLTWLCSICRREIAASRARAGRAAEVPLLEDAPATRAALEVLAASSNADPDSQLRRRELTRLVQATLDHLPGHYGDALEWRYAEGLSVEEIAAKLGIGYKAAESLLSRARRAFKESFEPC
jgi:RNA polymerase sigma-70 factor (ECF subfamily)